VKDLGTLIHAVARLPRPARLLLLVIGDGSERAGLEALAHETGADAVVRFLGHREDARDLLAGCDLYVNSSISEGISLTILEAMAARLAVVATRAGGTPEILDETCGRLVPLRDPAALGAALATLGADATLRAELGRAARARVEERFTLDRMVAQYRDVYRAVA
jgi:glycosyltransferase involved in cell wall biosynthesis